MADPEPIEEIMQKIKRKWDTDKENWSVLSNFDKDGNKEMIISQTPNAYWLKMRTVTAYNAMAYGKEIRNLDDDIAKEIKNHPNNVNSQEKMLQLFGMIVPTRKDLIYTAGIEKVSPPEIQSSKMKIEQKETDADKLFRLYLQKKWEREQELRNNMYL
jgi:hypothetical protein